jgi:hypothetical protein
MRTAVFLLAVGLPAAAHAQAPESEIHVAPLRVRDGVVSVGPATNVTNRPGYDNQPSFTPDGGAILYTSQRDGQTDIFRYDLRARTTTQLTRTPESEYSPSVGPDGRSMTVVRVELDSTQRLWRIPFDERARATVLLRDVKPVGYYAWADQRTLALFVLGAGDQPNTLQIARVGTDRTDTVMTGIGRSLHRIPGTGSVSFLHAAAAPRVINALDPATQAVRRVAQPLLGSEDFAWVNAQLLVMARDGRLFQHAAGPGVEPAADWREVGVLAAGTQVTRLAVSPRADWLAFVTQVTPPRPARDTAARRDSAAAAPDSGGVREADVRRLLTALAHDSLEGRRTATPGSERAARLIAEEFRRIGLRPAGDSGGYVQRIPLAATVGRGGRPGLALLPSWAAQDSVPATRRRVGMNVVGVIPGSDPALRDEVVLVDAHYDHLGIGAPVDPDSVLLHRSVMAARPRRPATPGQPPAPLSAEESARLGAMLDSVRRIRPAEVDSIFNGADDDASGTVAVIEIARQLLRGPPPKRTVVFAAMTGEEMGLLGTRWYIDHPPLPLERMVGNLEIEMIGRPDSLAGGAGKAWLTGYERSTMGDSLRANGVPIVADPRPAQDFFQRSDNIAFARRGIPAHTLSTFDLHPEYHTPNDEVERVDFAHMTAVIAAAVRATRLLSDGAKPEWHPGGRP